MTPPTFRHRPDADPNAAGWSDGGDSPLAERLEHYGGTLSPDEETLSRMGSTIRSAFVQSLAPRETQPAIASGGPGEGLAGRGRHWWSRRRAVAAICAAAILTVSSFGLATAESGPGQPFYWLRLDIEAVNLPPAGSQDRLQVDLGRADARLDDIANSAAASDWNAAADAAGAYEDVLASVKLPADPTARAAALAHLEDQLERLEGLRAKSHGSETAELDRAIAALSRLLGIPVPTPADNSSASPNPHPTNHGRQTDTASAEATGSDPGHNHGKTQGPGTSHGPGDAGGLDDGPGDTGGAQPGPTARPSDGHGGGTGPSSPPGGGH